jgi:hypothetical protein
MAINKFNLNLHQRAERKLLITVAEWRDNDSGKLYVLQDKEPGDWDTKYTEYYTKSNDTYSPVTGDTAPAWAASTYYTRVNREILGRRTEDSSIEYNADIETTTDILGINYTDLNRTQPQQDFDPYLILGGSLLGEKLNDIRKRNALTELSDFTLYVITAFVGDAENGYEAERHSGCTITYNSIGGDANVNMPISAYFSNNLTNGVVDKLSDDFTFTPDVNV